MNKYSAKSKATALLSDDSGKIPPQAIDMEEAVLGAIMIEKQSFLIVLPYLKADDFYKEVHSEIFRSFERLLLKSEPIDLLTVVNDLREVGKLEFTGGAQYLAKLTSKVNSSANIEYHAAVIKETSKRRKLITLSVEATREAFDPTDAFSLILDKYQSGIYTIIQDRPAKDIGFTQQLAATYEQILGAKTKKFLGVPSKFSSDNKVCGGYKKGELRFVGARPGMGKTLHLINEALFMALQGYAVIIFSLEMPYKTIILRLLAAATQIDFYKLERGYLSPEEHQRLSDWINMLYKLRITIDDTPGIDFLYVSSKCRLIKMQNEMNDPSRPGLDIAFLDYFQLMTIHNPNKDNLSYAMGIVSRGLKNLSKEIDIAMVSYSQLSREVDKRPDKRPKLSDLRETGAIEQDSDVVQFLYRPAYYGISQDENGNPTAGVLEILTAKNRSGNLSTSVIKYMPETSTLRDFKDAEPEQEFPF